MTLSTSRQQFLAYETQTPENIQYGRKGGIFISNCICVAFVIFAMLGIIIAGVIAHFITYFKLSQTPVAFWDETEPFGQSSSESPDLRLPPYVTPSFYRLKLIADLDNSSFSGEVYITLRASTHVKEIILHAKNLSINTNAKLTEQIYEKVETLHSRSKREADDNSSIVATVIAENVTSAPSNITAENASTESATTTSAPTTSANSTDPPTTISPTLVDTQVTHSSVRTIKILQIMESTGDRLVLLLATTIKPDVDYILQLSFSGVISNSLTGFYKSTYTNKDKEERVLGVTQFEPTSARAAFPCFDEPAFKAKFEISIAHPKNITVLSNMKVATEEPFIELPNWQWTHFERSVEMSTYLVAYVLSDFKSLETTYVSKDNITKTIRVWTRPELISKANYAITITPKLLSYYEDVFGVPYALDKLDLIGIPDFSSGAMENWGLITFRETTLLFDEAQGVPRDKQGAAIDIAHELAHQWFGNLVTMRWWTDLWLNEGFATYVEYLGVDHVEPEWNMFEMFSRDKMDLLRSDALKNTNPVSQQVLDASGISQKFDEISYLKGSNLIRMLNHTVTEELFKKGLVIYLNDWKYSNAEENDLWEAMSKALQTDSAMKSLSVVEFMNTWTRQAGYPVVNVNRNYDTGIVEFEQRLFTSSKQPYQNMVDQLWQIPISYTSIEAPLDEWSTKPKTWLNERISVVNIPINATEALYVNVDAIGYYRVNYDQRNWELLSAGVRGGRLGAGARAQLLDDAFNLAKAAQLNYSYALDLAACALHGEDSRMVWDLLLNNMAFLRHNLRSTSGYVYFQDFMKLLLKKQLERVNYGLDPPKDDNEAFLIENLVMWDCYVQSQRCLDWVKNLFNSWMEKKDFNDNPIPSYLRSVVCNMALRYGGRREFDFLWNVFLNSTDPVLKSMVINNLPSTREESLITMLLEKSLSEIPKQYAVAVWSVEPPLGTRIAQRFLLDNFDRVYERFTQMDAFMFPTVLSGAFGFITGDDELDRLKSFALRHKAQLSAMSQTLQKIVDTATLRIDWLRRHAGHIAHWLQHWLEVHAATADVTNSTTTVPPIPYSSPANDNTTTTAAPSPAPPA